MEEVETEQVHSAMELKNESLTEDAEKESAQNFQKFIYDLFEKNGVLGDLRAYLRRHIVNVLTSAHVGDTPSCQKHFAQRLDLTTQAINMLIAEYLLRLDFSYSLSVFVSEIPLANMKFDFANCLMKGDKEYEHLRFKDEDVFGILNYLGVKIDSVHLNDVLEMYKKEESSPLLVCILKCLTIHPTDSPPIEQAALSISDSTVSENSSTVSPKPNKGRHARSPCKHYVTCQGCHANMVKAKTRYKKKKKAFVKRESSMSSVNVKNLLRNVEAAESSIIDEIFDQLKMVYEQEVDLVRAEEEKKVKRSLASHAVQLLHQRQELEDAFKAREAELELNVKQKKKFLWGLARALRDQHKALARAAQCLKGKEENLRSQILEAEKELRNRGEDIRAQISSELIVLENQLDSMRRERDSLHRERSELEQIRVRSDTGIKIQDLDDNANDNPAYHEIRSELAMLKKCIENCRAESKNYVERSVVTDIKGLHSKINLDVLNNEHNLRPNREDDRIKNNQLINDFKKPKNVNFHVESSEDIYLDRRESTSVDDSEPPAVVQLREENDRLREFVRMQQSQLVRVCRAAEIARPRTAPYMQTSVDNVNSTVSSNSFGWRKGAGEELNLYNTGTPSTVLTPTDRVPFVGILRDTHNDTRRHLLNQWCLLRKSCVGRSRTLSPPARRDRRDTPDSAGTSGCLAQTGGEVGISQQHFKTEHPQYDDKQSSRSFPIAPTVVVSRIREKSPKSVLREAKEKLKTQSPSKCLPSTSTREKSPSSVLREAKLRLLKLEIEAEAVEKSYLDFRKRRSASRTMAPAALPVHDEAVVTKDIGDLSIRRSRSLHKVDKYVADTSSHKDTKKLTQEDFDKYLREYRTTFNLTDARFNNRNAHSLQTKPIPKAFSTKTPEKTVNDDVNNYLETPLTEFRKYYKQDSKPNEQVDKVPIAESQKPVTIPPLKDIQIAKTDVLVDNKSNNNESESKKDAMLIEKNNKKVELEILKQNISKIYNIDMEPAQAVAENISNAVEMNKGNNMIRIEVENVNEVNTLNVTENASPDLLVVVQSNVESAAVPLSETESNKGEELSGNMTILISPRRSNEMASRSKSPESSRRSVSPEQAARLTRNDVFEAIFHADAAKAESSHETMRQDSSRDRLDSNSDYKEVPENYTDDFSADVDNYNTLSGNNSPISLPKSPIDDFWDT